MRTGKVARLGLFGVVVACGPAMVSAGPAKADCVEVDFEVRYENEPSWYPLGGPDHCVVPTPWTHMVEFSVERDFYEPPPGFPSGIWFHVWVPVP